MKFTDFATNTGTTKKYQVVITFNDESKLKQMDVMLASNQTEAKEKATDAYGRYGIKSIYCGPYRN